MKKIVSILFLLIFLAANTELHQLLRLPVLIHHYLEHRQEKPNTSYVDFLADHYADHQTHSDNNHHDHENLPFKTSDCATAHNSMAFVNQTQFLVQRPNTFQDKVLPIYDGGICVSAFLSTIWQPPKIS